MDFILFDEFEDADASSPGVMETFLHDIETRFGGVEGYVVEVLGFKQSDLEVIQRNLRES